MDVDAVWVDGGGTDFTDIIVTCPECHWRHLWEDRTTLGEILARVREHMKERHSD